MPGIMTEIDMLTYSGPRRDSSTFSLHGNQSLLSAMNNFVTAVEEMDDAVMIPSKLQDMPTPDINALAAQQQHQVEGGKSVVPGGSNNNDIDMFTYYTMLNAIKSELVQGPPKDETEGGEASKDDIAQQTATAFRHHLRGLFGVLRTMTSTAQVLTTTYKKEVGDTSTPSNMTSRTRSLSHFSL